jgi:hypothetical protein
MYPFQVLDGPHVGEGRDFLRVGLDASLEDDEPQEHASGDSEDTLLRFEFYAFRLETLEYRFKVGEEVGGFPRLDYDVIDVSLDRSANVFSKHAEPEGPEAAVEPFRGPAFEPLTSSGRGARVL